MSSDGGFSKAQLLISLISSIERLTKTKTELGQSFIQTVKEFRDLQIMVESKVDDVEVVAKAEQVRQEFLVLNGKYRTHRNVILSCKGMTLGGFDGPEHT